MPSMIPEAEAAILNITVGGGDCSDFGTWDPETNTCTLNTNITLGPDTAIEIASDGVTLDGAGHTMTANLVDRDSQYCPLEIPATDNAGVLIDGKSNIQIKNLDHFLKSEILQKKRFLLKNGIGLKMELRESLL